MVVLATSYQESVLHFAAQIKMECPGSGFRNRNMLGSGAAAGGV